MWQFTDAARGSEWAASYAARLNTTVNMRTSSTQLFCLVDSGHGRCTRVIFKVIDTTDERFTLLKPHQITLARRLEALESNFDALKDPQGRWIRRQMLEPNEVDFLERFERRGERIQWIPKDESAEHKSTNDFIWLSNGETATELKCASDRYTSVSAAISKSVKKARSHGIIKDVFIVDQGRYRLSSKLATHFTLYNLRNPRNAIRRLFVMHSNGAKFIEIELL